MAELAPRREIGLLREGSAGSNVETLLDGLDG